MGLGGVIVLLLIFGVVVYILLAEKSFGKKKTDSENPFSGMAKISVQLVKAPQELTEQLTPKWQAELTQKLSEEGYVCLGDYSYASTLFFWARTFWRRTRSQPWFWPIGWREKRAGRWSSAIWKFIPSPAIPFLSPPAPRMGPPNF